MAQWSEWVRPTVVDSSADTSGDDVWDDPASAIDGNQATFAETSDNGSFLVPSAAPVPDITRPDKCEILGFQARLLVSCDKGATDPAGISQVKLKLPSKGYSAISFDHVVDHTDAQWAYFGGESGWGGYFQGYDPSAMPDVTLLAYMYDPPPNPLFSTAHLRVHDVQFRFYVKGPIFPVSDTLTVSDAVAGSPIAAFVGEIEEIASVVGGQAQRFVAGRLLSDITGMRGNRYSTELDVRVCAHQYYTWPDGLMYIPEGASMRMAPHDVMAMDDGVRVRRKADGPMAELSGRWIWEGDEADTMERWLRQTSDTPFTASTDLLGQPAKIYGAWLSPPDIRRQYRHLEVSGEMRIVW